VRGTMVKKHVVELEPGEAPQHVEREVAPPRHAARPSKARGRWLVAVLLVATGVAGGWCAYHFGLVDEWAGKLAHSNGKKAALGFASAKAARGGAATSPAVPMATVRAELAPSSDVLRLTGTLVADERSSVASNASGIVAEVRVDRGSLVRKGDVLVQIDPTDAKNKLAEGQAMLDELKVRLGLNGNMDNFHLEEQPEVRLAKAAADLASANLRRAEDLYAKEVITTEAFDQAKAENELAVQRYRQAQFQIRQVYQTCKTAQVKLAILQKAVDDTTIRAPFDGWVVERLVSVGEQISSGMQATTVVTLVRIDPLRLSLVVPQQDIGRIALGQTVRFRVDSFPDRVFEAEVRFITPVVADNTRSMVVEAVTPNPEGLLRPGLFATAEVVLRSGQNDVLVPLVAVERTGEVGRVLVVRDGVAREQVVALGETKKDKVVVRSGLTGAEVLLARPELFHDGDKVSP